MGSRITVQVPVVDPNVQSKTSARAKAKGKFLFVGDRKFYVRGVTYGTFSPGSDGEPYRDVKRTRQDMEQMAANGINSIRTYTVPPPWFLELASVYGLRVMVGIPWGQHIAFLEDGRRARDIEKRIRSAVQECADFPSILCYAIGNEIPASIARWYGHQRIEKFLERLYCAAKDADPGALVTYVNYPTTEYLELPFLDLACFNVYLEEPENLKNYLARLHNVAGDRPLILAEFGADSRSKGKSAQARMLHWQVRSAFAGGCAGAFAYAWSDEWHTGGAEILDWDFGLTDREGRPKPALAAIREAFERVPFSSDVDWPRISVVVCVYNGADTVEECLRGLVNLDYPHYEVIVVDDGSSDATAAIASRFPVQLHRTRNQGLSAARNLGLKAASGEIVAYLDGDAWPDPQWLKYLAADFMRTEHVGIGGPNIAPPGDGPIAECVDAAPGNPIHVLLSDEEAEHIPGCNMAFRKKNLEAIDGFDPRFRTAGDDVDVCWRLRERGWTLGYSPSAVVWHHRRPSIGSYWSQQKGYGEAEAMLERKWPDKYNRAGNVTWTGQIYGKGISRALRWGASRIYHGVWGSALFQSVYSPEVGVLESLPLTPEWYVVVVGLALLSLLGLSWGPLLFAFPLFLLASALFLAQAFRSAAREGVRHRARPTSARAHHLIWTTLLHLEQPLARLWGRRIEGIPRGKKLRTCFPWPHQRSFWFEQWKSAEVRINAIVHRLRQEEVPVVSASPYDRWDLAVHRGFLGGARLALLSEEHGSGKQLIRVRYWPVLSPALPVLLVPFLVLGAGAALDRAWMDSSVLIAFALLVAATAIRECVASMGDLNLAARALENESREPSLLPKPAGRSPRARLTVLDLVKRTLGYLPPYARLGIASVVVTLLLTSVGLLLPWPLTVIVDSVLNDHSLPYPLNSILAPLADNKMLLLALFALAELGLKLASNGLQVLGTYLHARLDLGIGLDFRSDLFKHSQRLSIGFHEQQRSGMMIYIINFLTTAAPTLILSLMPLVQSLLTLLGMLWISMQIDTQLALLSLIIVPFVFYSVGYYSTHIERQVQKVKEMEGESLSIMYEALSMLKVVMAFGREQHEHRRFEVQGQEAVDSRVQLTVRQTVFSLVVNSITVIGTATVLGFGAFHVLEGRLTAGQLLVILSYIAAIYAPLESISGTLGSLQEQFVNLRMSFGLLDIEPEIQDAPGALALDRARGAVRFEEVSFDYPGRRGTLKRLSFEARPGQVIALVGPTGAGKTTLLSLLPRFYDPTQGRILMDGQDLRKLKVRSLRSQISVVLQEPLLFSGSIAENIRYGRLDASREELVAAAQAANAHEFIQRQPQGYDTVIGETGARLSGGERQRIAVARAFLRQAPLLLLDEPTSSIDSRTESVILDALDHLMEGRTTFITAHRLSTVRHADLILVLDRGELVEQGTHDELLARRGLYYQLYLTQNQPRSRLAVDPSRGIGLRMAHAEQEPSGETSHPQQRAAR